MEYIGHDCDAPLGIVVHQRDGPNVRLPVIDDGLQLYERKVGPTSITRRAEVTVPIDGAGSDNWLQYIPAFSEPDRLAGPDPTAPAAPRRVDNSELDTEPFIQQATVIGKPIDENGNPVGEYAPVFRGYVAAVGSTEGANRARFRVYDPMKFLSQIEADTSFNKPTVRDVLRYVTDTLSAKQSVFQDVGLDVSGEYARPIATKETLSNAIIRIATGLVGAVFLERNYTFSPNRDTLADVVELVQENADVQIWFQPSGENGITLVAAEDPSATFDLTPDTDSAPRVIGNNALYEMRPFNALRLKGKSGERIAVGGKDVVVPFGPQYPEAKAVYPPLRDRFGGELVVTETTDNTDEDTIRETATSRLKAKLDEVSGGSITTTLAPQCTPFDVFKATPACSGVAADIDSLRYEAQEVVHSITPDNNNLPQTELSVSMEIDKSLIEVEATTKGTRDGGPPTREDPLDDYTFGPGSP